MAFPTVVNTANTQSSGATSSMVLTMPATIVALRLLLAVCGSATSEAGSVAISGWTKLGSVDSGGNLSAFGKIATGSDTGTITGTSTYRGVTVYQIDNWSGILAGIGWQAGGASLDPPALTMAQSDDYLWLGCVKNALAPTAAPANYSNLITAGDSSGAFVGTARRTLTASSEDPGTFSATSFQPIGATLAIPPVPSVVTSNYARRLAQMALLAR